MARFVFSTLAALLFLSFRPAYAQQEPTWIQIEALPSLLDAEERIRDYARDIPNVNGFGVGSGWYAVALGPYSEDEADAVLRRLRRDRQIPRDSFVAHASNFTSQFWPIGANALTQAAPVVTPQPSDPEPITLPSPNVPAEETRREALRSEARLISQEKKDLQIALRWAGFYNAAIDASFGAGTRRAMSAWQSANGFEPTGVLTIRQRAELLRKYNAVLEGMALRRITDTTAGIEMDLPMGVIEFDAYEAPFARYKSRGDLGARVLLISQPGEQRRLFGLYDILQTLEVVPLDGPRERKNNGFVITGTDARIASHTEVSLRNGEIKGFMLIWPAGDEERRSRVLEEMRNSFTRIEGVMETSVGPDSGPSVDLLAGLQIRKPRASRTGFFVTASGMVMTTHEVVQGCSRISLDGHTDARVTMTDEALGLALLTPESRLAPMEVAEFAANTPRLQSEIAVAGFSYEGKLGAPSITFGKLVDQRGLNGEEALDRYALTVLPGDAGGPVMDQTGAVIGMLLPRGGDGRTLPAEVNFSLDSMALTAAMRRAGVSPQDARATRSVAPENLTRKARGMAVLVSCWE